MSTSGKIGGLSILTRVLIPLLVSAGCHFDTSGLPPAGFIISTGADIMRCPIANLPATAIISGPTTFSSIKNYGLVDNVWGTSGILWSLYVDFGANIHDVGILAGCTQLKTDRDDWAVDAADFLTVELSTDVQAVYVVYDARVDPLPSWLLDGARFSRVMDPKNPSQPAYLKVASNGQIINMGIWVAINLSHTHDKLNLPGNRYGNPGFSKVAPASPLMYVVFLRPLTAPDCSNPTFNKRDYRTACYTPYDSSQESEARQEAVQATTRDFQAKWGPDKQVRNVQINSCAWLGACTTTVYGSMLTIQPTDYSENSEVEFSSAVSTATVTIGEDTATTHMSGHLQFEYQLNSLAQMETMRINNFYLEGGDFDSRIGLVSNIVVGLLKACDAQCMDSAMPFGSPCRHYRVPVGTFLCTEGCVIDGDPLSFTTANEGALDIMLDAATRDFRIIGGPLHTTVAVDDENVPVDVSIDLTGHVLNYAPNAAAGSEGNPFAECSEQSNHTPMYLYAGQSFDVDETLPPGSYEWYEDYDLVTERLLGTGSLVIIPPHTLGYGIHRITLLVRDSYGVAATDTMEVEVRDTVPPTLNVPADIVIFQAAATAGPVQVEIGQATGSDTCDSRIRITHNAPAGGVFQPGQTDVTWVADDGRTNLTTKIQRVVIILLDESDTWLSKVKDGTLALSQALDQNRASLAVCTNMITCRGQLQLLLGSFNQFVELLGGLSVPAGQEATRNRIIENLRLSVAALREADAQLADVGDAGQAFERLAVAGERLATASGPLQTVVDLVDQSVPTSPRCFIATAAYGSDMASEVIALRRFRDSRLLPTRPGRFLVSVYYQVSPPIAAMIARHDSLRLLARLALRPVIASVTHPVAAIVCLVATAGLVLQRRRLSAVAYRCLWK